MEDSINQTTASKDEFGQDLLPPRIRVDQIVTVLLSNKLPYVRKDFHCIKCGRIVFNYFTETRVIIVGEMREVKRPIDVMCSRSGCKIMYRIGQ